MNGKKVNWFFLTTILLHLLIVVLMVVFRYVFALGIIANFLVSSAMIVVPAFVFLACSGESPVEAAGFHKIRWSTVFMIVLFTFLTMPLTTVINTFSMFFVENAVTEISGQVLELPFVVAFFFMAVVAPVCEEVVYRGIAYQGYKRSGTLLQAALCSAMIFAVGHMNFNQAAYAFVIGVMLVLLVEATGSIWASIIYHVVFNGYSVCVMYLAGDMLETDMTAGLPDGWTYQDSLLYGLGVSMVTAAVMTSFAVCVLIWIARNEGRIRRLQEIWATRHERKGKVITIPLVIALILAFAYMVAEVILYKMIL